MKYNENNIIKSLRNNSELSLPDNDFNLKLKSRILKSEKQNINSLSYFKFILPVIIVVIIIGVFAFVSSRRITSSDEKILIDQNLLDNPIPGEITVGESLQNDPNTKEYIQKVGGSFIKENELVPGVFNITFKHGTTEDQVKSYIASFSGTIKTSIPQLNTWTIEVVDKNLTVDKIPSSELVVATEQESMVFISQVNDPEFKEQWALNYINAPQAWEEIRSNNKIITIAVIDTGACFDHPDMLGKYLSGYNVLNPTTAPTDDAGHGCGVSGVIAAQINNNLGIAGVSPKVSIYPVKVLGINGGNWSDVAQGIIRAADANVAIINLSLGSTSRSALGELAVNYAKSKGIIIVASAGNNASNLPSYPAAYEGVISVGSIDQNGKRSWFSNYGSHVDIYAPGGGIYSTKLGNSYGFMSGTSFSAPYVAGSIALEMYFCQPVLSNTTNGNLKINSVNGKWSHCEPNTAPQITSTLDATSYTAGDNLSYQIVVVDKEKNKLNFGFSPNKENALINPDTGLFTWTNMPAGTHTFTLSVSDGEFKTEQNITIVVNPKATPKPPAANTPLVSSYFVNAQAEYNNWKAANPGMDCAATLLHVTSSKTQNFEIWFCTNLNSNTPLAIQKNLVTGAVIPVKFAYSSASCPTFVNYGNRYQTSTGFAWGNQCLIDQMKSRNLP